MHRSHPRPATGVARRLSNLIVLAAVALGATACQTSAPSAAAPSARARVQQQPVAGGPVLLRAGIGLRKVVGVTPGAIKLALNPADGGLYMLHPIDGLLRVTLESPSSTTRVAEVDAMIDDGTLAGMTFGPDGAVYVVANREVEATRTQAIVRKGVAADGGFRWQTVATTEPYPMSNTPFDHRFNGMVVSDDGKWLYLGSGSRTDHGEVENNGYAFPDTREVPLSAKIFRVPTDAVDLTLPNDAARLVDQGVIFATGTRNAFDLAFAPNGDLFAIDNGPDADYPDELNWIREAQHYGFPWRFGNQDNPQQFADYDSTKDLRLQSDFTAVKTGAYHNDPSFPKPPATMRDPVINLGPDAAQYRGDDGKQYDSAAEGKPMYGFTPHRSPLGLVFATGETLPADLRGDGETLSAFLLSWGAAGGTLSDKGQDLLHLRLTKRGDNYEAVTNQIVRDFTNPIDAVLIENRLYVLEYGQDGAIWELTFN